MLRKHPKEKKSRAERNNDTFCCEKEVLAPSLALSFTSPCGSTFDLDERRGEGRGGDERRGEEKKYRQS